MSSIVIRLITLRSYVGICRLIHVTGNRPFHYLSTINARKTLDDLAVLEDDHCRYGPNVEVVHKATVLVY
jgi:hypothetical protein